MPRIKEGSPQRLPPNGCTRTVPAPVAGAPPVPGSSWIAFRSPHLDVLARQSFLPRFSPAAPRSSASPCPPKLPLTPSCLTFGSTFAVSMIFTAEVINPSSFPE